MEACKINCFQDSEVSVLLLINDLLLNKRFIVVIHRLLIKKKYILIMNNLSHMLVRRQLWLVFLILYNH